MVCFMTLGLPLLFHKYWDLIFINGKTHGLLMIDTIRMSHFFFSVRSSEQYTCEACQSWLGGCSGAAIIKFEGKQSQNRRALIVQNWGDWLVW